MGQFLMPSLGADMEAGTLVEWLVKPGDKVSRGDIIAVVETQKGTIEIEVFEDGVLEGFLVEPGRKVPVGTPLASIVRNNELYPTTLANSGKSDSSFARSEHADSVVLSANTKPTFPAKPLDLSVEEKEGSPKKTERLRITPAARRAAKQAGIDVLSIATRGSGPDGVFTLDDVIALRSTMIDDARQQDNFAGMRKAIAAAMSRSKKEIPHYYLADTVDISLAEQFLTSTNATRSAENRLLLGALHVKVVARALEKYPEFNGHFVDGQFQASKAIHVGVAINIRGGGLVAPALHDANEHDLDSIMSAMRDLVLRVRAGRYRSSELTDATITVSSLGERGVETLFGVIYPPQVALVGIGSPVERPWIADGIIDVRRLTNFTLSADHRVSDGHRGALFLQEIGKILQRPEALKR